MSKGGDDDGGGSQTQSTTTQVVLPDWVNQAAQYNLNFARNVANQPYTPYTGERVAPFDRYQRLAQNRALSFANKRYGFSELNAARNATRKVAQYRPDSFLDADISAYMNPFTENVTDATLAQLDRGRQMAIQGNAEAAARAGAFGGSRHGVVEAETNRGFADTAARTLAGLNADAFNNATTLFNQDMANERAALGLNLQGANQLANLGTLNRSFRMQDIDTVNQVGGARQAMRQKGDDINYGNFTEQRDWPLRQLAILNSTLSATPYGQTTSQTGTGTMSGAQSNPFGAALGGAALGGSLFGSGGALAGTLGMTGPWGAALGAGIGLLGSLF